MISSKFTEMAKMALQMWKKARGGEKKEKNNVSAAGRMSAVSPTSPLSPLSPLTPSLPQLYRVTDSYSPQVDGEIPLAVGDIVTKVKDLGNGWTLGRNASRDTLGIFPTQCIWPLGDPTPVQPVNKQQSKSNTSLNRQRSSSLKRQQSPSNFGQADSQVNPLYSRPPSRGNVDASGSSNHYHYPHYPVRMALTSKGQLVPINITENLINSPEIEDKTILSPDSIDNHSPNQHANPGNCSLSRIDSPENDPCQTEGDEAYYSNSLLSPKHNSYNGSTTGKPKLVVKPHTGTERQRSDTPASVSSGRMSTTSEQDDLQHSPRVLPKVTITGNPQQKARQSVPPGQLPLTNVTNPSMNITDIEKATTAPELPIHHPTSNHNSLLGVGKFRNRSASPSLHPLDMANHINTVDMNMINIEMENDNYTNETLRRTPKHGDNDGYAEVKQRFYEDYRTLNCPPPLSMMDKTYNHPHLRYKPILKSQKVGDSKGQHIYYREPLEKNKSSRLVLSIIAGLMIGFLLFLWMFFYLDYSFVVALAVAITIALSLCIGFALSRLCRCMGALMLPSLCTTRGRISFLILVTGFLLGGPVTNIYHNMSEISRSMSCSAEQSYNQTMLLLEPFDAMMRQLDHTIHVLQGSAHEVHAGLLPLDEGLDSVEMDIANGKVQLSGTERTCRSMVDRAFNECATGVHNAQSQCFSVISALSVVYVHAKDVLDRINPERWAPKQQHLFKRQIITAGGTVQEVEETEEDICEPLDTIMVCQKLNNSESLCRPSKWAGEAIQEAINATQSAMVNLKRALQFEVDPDPYYNTRSNASKVVYEVRKKVDEEYSARTRYFELVISILIKLTPLGLFLLIYVCYLHIKHYMSKDTYDNIYVTENFKALDHKRSEVAGDTLFPLKKCELNYLIESTMSDLSPPEDGLYRIGLCVLVLHLLLSFSCYIFDYILYWVLALIQHHGSPEFDVTGKAALDQVVSGEGVIVELLDVFLNGFHPGTLYGFSANTNECLPKPWAPSIIYLLVIIAMYFVLILTILLKAYILRFRNKITGYFYPERQKARIVHLYNVLLNQRSRMPKMLQQRAKIAHKERVMQEQVSVLHKMAARCAPCRIFLYESPRCLVCDCAEDQSFRDCETERCGGVFCAECYEDLARVCPLCLQGIGMEYSDDDDNYEELEDDLQPYCRSSKIYL